MNSFNRPDSIADEIQAHCPTEGAEKGCGWEQGLMLLVSARLGLKMLRSLFVLSTHERGQFVGEEDGQISERDLHSEDLA